MKDFLKRHLKLWFTLAYLFPYLFFAMWYDADCHTALMYPVVVLCMGLLCWLAFQLQFTRLAILGNILSFLSSLICVLAFRNERWLWFFKPFSAIGLLIFLTMIFLALQLIYWKIAGRIQAEAEQKAHEAQKAEEARKREEARRRALEDDEEPEEPQEQAQEQPAPQTAEAPAQAAPAAEDGGSSIFPEL